MLSAALLIAPCALGQVVLLADSTFKVPPSLLVDYLELAELEEAQLSELAALRDAVAALTAASRLKDEQAAIQDRQLANLRAQIDLTQQQRDLFEKALGVSERARRRSRWWKRIGVAAVAAVAIKGAIEIIP